eukprot:CAMPEP_0206051746 /NCGR_PEP_ID=MMETSP1466-20131121/32146_1 /ASSEMBLY_ACC=CAM_ASM_001126 /TAXON_ID=44452 /ORGANISM="Pavlova gyrans, Strain CCMP608" /LENGTH=444 /DNA_ID=CAMNT_0053426877 /DNA_START=83 /DNA_END=1417 /DNA_ORIENTATION=+
MDLPSSPLWSWYVFADKWVHYDAALSSRLEDAFAAGSEPHVDAQLGPSGTKYAINVLTMEQVNKLTNYSRFIRREATAASPGDTRWEWDAGGGRWLPYAEQARQQLEIAFKASWPSTVLYMSDTPYIIRFAEMVQENTHTGFLRKIRGPGTSVVPGQMTATTQGAVPAHIMPRPGPARHQRMRIHAPLQARADAAHTERLTFTSHEGQIDFASYTDWRLLRPTEYDKDEDCPITCCPFGDDPEDPVVKLRCGCKFNKSTIERALLVKPQCPLCSFHFALPGAMPSGSLVVARDSEPCEGHEDAATWVLIYSFPSGIQGPQHPAPGEPYHGTERQCFIPDTQAGNRTVQLLKEAFLRGITFKIGTSVTTGRPNTVTWNIHHKTSRGGGAQRYGWPDPSYHDRCAAECAALGLMMNDDGTFMDYPVAPSDGAGAGGGTAPSHGSDA